MAHSKRNYSSTSVERSLQGNFLIGATTLTLDSDTGLVGLAFPYTLIIDPDILGKEEAITVLSRGTGYTWTVVRGSDGTAAVEHFSGAKVRHMITARDLQESQDHIDSATAYTIKNPNSDAAVTGLNITIPLHGIASGEGVVVGTLKTQTLTNKTLTAPTLTSATLTTPTLNGSTLTGTVTATGSTLVGFHIPSDANNNTKLGTSALNALGTGASNTAIGQNALLVNTGGFNNVAVGNGSLDANTTGFGNVGIGNNAPGARLDIGTARSTVNTLSQILQTTGTGVVGDSNRLIIRCASTAGTTLFGAGIAGYLSTTASNKTDLLLYYGTDAATTEGARLDSAGAFTVSTGPSIVYTPAPAATISALTTLTNAQILPQIVVTSGTTFTLTMPLGTTLETLVNWSTTNIGFNFTVINTASGTITMAVNTGVTAVGTLTVLTGISANFRLRRTAANTFIMYRV